MKKLLIALFLAAATLPFASGCATPAYSGGPPTIQFPEEKQTGEHANRIARIWHIEQRQLVEDIDLLLLWDAPSRLSRWNIR